MAISCPGCTTSGWDAEVNISMAIYTLKHLYATQETPKLLQLLIFPSMGRVNYILFYNPHISHSFQALQYVKNIDMAHHISTVRTGVMEKLNFSMQVEYYCIISIAMTQYICQLDLRFKVRQIALRQHMPICSRLFQGRASQGRSQ